MKEDDFDVFGIADRLRAQLRSPVSFGAASADPSISREDATHLLGVVDYFAAYFKTVRDPAAILRKWREWQDAQIVAPEDAIAALDAFSDEVEAALVRATMADVLQDKSAELNSRLAVIEDRCRLLEDRLARSAFDGGSRVAHCGDLPYCGGTPRGSGCTCMCSKCKERR